MPRTYLYRQSLLLAILHGYCPAHASPRSLQDPVRHFRQTQNIAIFFQFLDEVELPDVSRSHLVNVTLVLTFHALHPDLPI